MQQVDQVLDKLTLEETKALTRSNLVDDVDDHLPISRSRRRALQTSSASVLGHTYGLTKTSVPSLQLGSGSRGSTRTSNTTAWWWRNNSSRASPKPWLVTVEQREERPRGENEQLRERSSTLQYIGGRRTPRGGVRLAHGGSPHLSLFMWVDTPLIHSKSHFMSGLSTQEIPMVFLSWLNKTLLFLLCNIC